MRLAVAIIVAVMSVVTGGPLRCPCQLAVLFNNRLPTAPPLQATRLTAETERCSTKHCPCKSHQPPVDPEQPAERTPVPGAPCGHCPNFDLGLPVGNGDRLQTDRDTGDFTSAPFARDTHVFLTACLDTPVTAIDPIDSSAPDRLRYCHSFRC